VLAGGIRNNIREKIYEISIPSKKIETKLDLVLEKLVQYGN